MEWHSLTIKETLKELSSRERGLSAAEVEKRLKKFGPNKLPEPKRFTRLHIFLRQFKSPLVYLLVVAGGVSFALGEATDSYIILVAVFLTVVFGYFQEQKAERTLETLEKMVKHRARVMRDGKEQEIEAEELVPGDIVFISSGDKVPADIRLVHCKNLTIEEAPLTGESMSVEKFIEPLDVGVPVPERKNMAFMGTIVARGRGKGIVAETATQTQFGKIAQSLTEIGEGPTPFQQKVGRLARWISLILIAIVSAIFLGGFLRGIEFAEIFTTSVAVAVAAIPESLAIAVTVILAVGMVRLLRHKALTRKLISAETLGGTTVICSDKTGTITEGRMKVAEVFTPLDRRSSHLTGQAPQGFISEVGAARSRELALEIGMIANEAYVENPEEDVKNWKIHGDPTEKAFIYAGIEAGLANKLIEGQEKILDEIPFESENQFMATLVSLKDASDDSKFLNVIYYKGAPEKILQGSTFVHDPGSEEAKMRLDAKYAKKLEEIFEDFSRKGLRVLAVAYREVGPIESIGQIGNVVEDLTFVGFIALHDPIRKGVISTIAKAKEAGIKVVMITGDHKYTAEAIAKELGLRVDHEKIIEGAELAKMDDATLQKEVKNISVYARILPHDKLRIIEAFQKNGEVVAMTGDGVNDAPALKKADIGVAMGAGTDVAKEASDMIILDNNFKSIVRAVEQGRVIFDNLRKVVTYLLASSFTEIILLGGSIIAGFPLPVLASQILWVNLVEDALPAFALSYEPKEKDIMKLAPLGRKTPILDRGMKAIIFIVGIISDLIVLGLFFWLFSAFDDITYVRTMVFAVLGTNSLLYIFSIKSLRHSIFRTNLLSNKFLVASTLFGFAMMGIAIYVPLFRDLLHTVPLEARDWGIIAMLAIIEITCIEIAKRLFITRRMAK